MKIHLAVLSLFYIATRMIDTAHAMARFPAAPETEVSAEIVSIDAPKIEIDPREAFCSDIRAQRPYLLEQMEGHFNSMQALVAEIDVLNESIAAEQERQQDLLRRSDWLIRELQKLIETAPPPVDYEVRRNRLLYRIETIQGSSPDSLLNRSRAYIALMDQMIAQKRAEIADHERAFQDIQRRLADTYCPE